jgi:hypothetical protein
MCFHLFPRVSSVKTQLMYCQLNWRHVSTQGVIIRPIIEPCMRYIKWKCTFLGSQNVYNIERTWLQIRLIYTILYILKCILLFLKSAETGNAVKILKVWRDTTFHVWKTRGCQCCFRLLMMGAVSSETRWASYKYGVIKFWYTVASCWIFLYGLYYDERIH